MDFKELFAIIRRRWLLIVTFMVVALVGTSVFSLFQTPQYSSNARLFVSANATGAEGYTGDLVIQQQVASFAQVATSNLVLNQVLEKTGVNYTPDKLKSSTRAGFGAQQNLVTLEVRDPSPTQAQKLCNGLAEVMVETLPELRGEADDIKVTITDQASFDNSPVSPNWQLNLVVALLLGLVMGSAVALIRDLLDTTIKSTSDITRDHDLPVMASVGFDKSISRDKTIADFDTPRAESFRMLRTNLQFLDIDVNMKSLVVTSPLAQDGKTSTAINLAATVAQTGRRVLIVDGDLRRPSVARLMGLPGNVGLTNVLVGQTDLQSALQRDADTGVTVLASGPLPPNPTEILQSEATHSLFRQLEQAFDLMIVDAPPLLPLADPAVLAVEVDGVILVVRHSKTTRDQLNQAVERLKSVGARIFGVVANMTPERRSRFYGYENYENYSMVPPEEDVHA